MDSNSKKKTLTPASLNQIQILSVLSNASAADKTAAIKLSKTPSGNPSEMADLGKLQIEEISELSGLKDEKETQRFLFILEGQKLVSPFPVGDFTSKTWQITTQGIQTLKHIASVGM